MRGYGITNDDIAPFMRVLVYLRLIRKQEDRKERQGHKSGGLLPLSVPEEVDPPQTEDFKIDEYKDMMKGSFDTGDPLTTNLYVGNINPKVHAYVQCRCMCVYWIRLLIIS